MSGNRHSGWVEDALSGNQSFRPRFSSRHVDFARNARKVTDAVLFQDALEAGTEHVRTGTSEVFCPEVSSCVCCCAWFPGSAWSEAGSTARCFRFAPFSVSSAQPSRFVALFAMLNLCVSCFELCGPCWSLLCFQSFWCVCVFYRGLVPDSSPALSAYHTRMHRQHPQPRNPRTTSLPKQIHPWNQTVSAGALEHHRGPNKWHSRRGPGCVPLVEPHHSAAQQRLPEAHPLCSHQHRVQWHHSDRDTGLQRTCGPQTTGPCGAESQDPWPWNLHEFA